MMSIRRAKFGVAYKSRWNVWISAASLIGTSPMVVPLGKPLYNVVSDYQQFRYFYFALSNISSWFGFHNISSDCLSEKANISLKQIEYSYPIVAKLLKIFQNRKSLTDFNSHSHSYISSNISRKRRERGRSSVSAAICRQQVTVDKSTDTSWPHHAYGQCLTPTTAIALWNGIGDAAVTIRLNGCRPCYGAHCRIRTFTTAP